jgi:hypothetical protein
LGEFIARAAEVSGYKIPRAAPNLQRLKAREKIAQGKRSETSAALGKSPTNYPSPERATRIRSEPERCGQGAGQWAYLILPIFIRKE